MKNIKNYNDFTNESVSLVGFGILSIVIFLIWLNSRYVKFGIQHRDNETETWQKYPFKGLFKYLKMSNIIRKYRKQLNKIDDNILNRDPDIKKSLDKLKEKGEPDSIDMTNPTLYSNNFVNKVLSNCNQEEKDLVNHISNGFSNEMDKLFPN